MKGLDSDGSCNSSGGGIGGGGGTPLLLMVAGPSELLFRFLSSLSTLVKLFWALVLPAAGRLTSVALTTLRSTLILRIPKSPDFRDASELFFGGLCERWTWALTVTVSCRAFVMAVDCWPEELRLSGAHTSVSSWNDACERQCMYKHLFC